MCRCDVACRLRRQAASSGEGACSCLTRVAPGDSAVVLPVTSSIMCTTIPYRTCSVIVPHVHHIWFSEHRFCTCKEAWDSADLSPAENQIGEVCSNVEPAVGAQHIMIGPLRGQEGMRGHMDVILWLGPGPKAELSQRK